MGQEFISFSLLCLVRLFLLPYLMLSVAKLTATSLTSGSCATAFSTVCAQLAQTIPSIAKLSFSSIVVWQRLLDHRR